LERCEVHVQDQPDKVQCRFIVKLVCHHGNFDRAFFYAHRLTSAILTGVTKIYKLTYESVEVMQALFNKNAAHNSFNISARMLKEYAEYFGPKAEQLDISAEVGRVTFASFTEKIMDGRGMRDPMMIASVQHY
jgi:cell cycle checkpoint control protein RAD9A